MAEGATAAADPRLRKRAATSLLASGGNSPGEAALAERDRVVRGREARGGEGGEEGGEGAPAGAAAGAAERESSAVSGAVVPSSSSFSFPCPRSDNACTQQYGRKGAGFSLSGGPPGVAAAAADLAPPLPVGVSGATAGWLPPPPPLHFPVASYSSSISTSSPAPHAVAVTARHAAAPALSPAATPPAATPPPPATTPTAITTIAAAAAPFPSPSLLSPRIPSSFFLAPPAAAATPLSPFDAAAPAAVPPPPPRLRSSPGAPRAAGAASSLSSSLPLVSETAATAEAGGGEEKEQAEGAATPALPAAEKGRRGSTATAIFSGACTPPFQSRQAAYPAAVAPERAGRRGAEPAGRGGAAAATKDATGGRMGGGAAVYPLSSAAMSCTLAAAGWRAGGGGAATGDEGGSSLYFDSSNSNENGGLPPPPPLPTCNSNTGSAFTAPGERSGDREASAWETAKPAARTSFPPHSASSPPPPPPGFPALSCASGEGDGAHALASSSNSNSCRNDRRNSSSNSRSSHSSSLPESNSSSSSIVAPGGRGMRLYGRRAPPHAAAGAGGGGRGRGTGNGFGGGRGGGGRGRTQQHAYGNSNITIMRPPLHAGAAAGTPPPAVPGHTGITSSSSFMRAAPPTEGAVAPPPPPLPPPPPSSSSSFSSSSCSSLSTSPAPPLFYCGEEEERGETAAAVSVANIGVRGRARLQNDYTQHFVDVGERPQNFIRDCEEERRFLEYPKLERLMKLKKIVQERRNTPSMCIQADLRNFDWSMLGDIKFDVLLVDPPWQEYYDRCAAIDATNEDLTPWTVKEMLNLPLETIGENPSFCFLWCGVMHLEDARLLLAKWGYRRCEDICWLKTNKRAAQKRREQGAAHVNDVLDHRASHLAHDDNTLLQRTTEHCLMGIKGTVRRSQDTRLIHANLDTDILVCEEEAEVGSTRKPEELYDVIERFCLGRRRIELFGRDCNRRAGWVTVGCELGLTTFDAKTYVSYFEGDRAWPDATDYWGGRYVGTSPEIEVLRPKSPPRGSNLGDRNSGGS